MIILMTVLFRFQLEKPTIIVYIIIPFQKFYLWKLAELFHSVFTVYMESGLESFHETDIFEDTIPEEPKLLQLDQLYFVLMIYGA